MSSDPRVKYSVKLTDSSGRWFNGKVSEMNRALQTMANTILKESQALAPTDTGVMKRGARVVTGNKQAAVIYPGPYAGYQERGERYGGSHKVRHYTTPGTGKRYLKTTGNRVVERGIRWYLSHS